MNIEKTQIRKRPVTTDREQEVKAMEAYKRSVTKSPETANAFLKRIGAYDIKR